MLRALWRSLCSIKTTAWLMVVLAALLLLRVVLPQSDPAGDEAIAALTADSAVNRFFLVRLGLANVPTSPPFVAALTLFFGNLVAVLVDRTAPTLRRLRARAPTGKQLRKRALAESAVRLARPAGWAATAAAATLERLGYRISRPDEQSLLAEKNRTAILGFLVFHASFIVLCAGGLMLYYTRSVSAVVLTEGQTLEGATRQVLRRPLLGELPALGFKLTRVEPTMQAGKAIQLAAEVELPSAGAEPQKRVARVNHPAAAGEAELLVDKVGVAGVLRLLDEQGYSLDLVAMPSPTKPGDSSPAPLGPVELELMVELAAVPVDEHFPTRDRLAQAAVPLRLYHRGERVFAGSLRRGQAASAGRYRVKLEEVRYWVRLQIIAERGGGLLLVGFVLAVAGLIWRLLFVRREVALTWDEAEVVLTGRAEFFQSRFRAELLALGELLVVDEQIPRGQ